MALEWRRMGGSVVFRDRGSKGEFLIGEFASATAGKGQALSSSRTAAFRVYADDGQSALTAGTYRGGISRLLLKTAVTAGVTAAGFQAQIKVAANAAVDWLCGLWGYAEASGAAVSDIAGVRATVDIPAGCTISTGKKAAGLIIDSIDLAGTHTGKAAMIYAPSPTSGSWDFLLALGGTPTGVIATKSSAMSLLSATDRLIIQDGTVTKYIPVVTTWG